MALSPVNGVNGINGVQSSISTDHPLDPLKQPSLDKIENASVVPAVGTPLDPDSINIHPPNGTPPPPNGQLLEDVRMAEQEDVLDVPDVEMATHETGEFEEQKPLNGINGRSSNVQSPASPPPESQRESPLNTQPSQDASAADPDERPAKRPRKMSDPDAVDVHGESSSLLATSPQPSTSNVPSNLPPPVPMSATQHRFCISTIRILKKLKDAAPFLHPVDPIALGIPHYPTIVKNPMDLNTVERKLISSNPSKPDPTVSRPPYLSADEFIHDVKLIFNNCAIFNGVDHVITQMGRRLEAVFDKQIKQLPANEESVKITSSSKSSPPPPPAAAAASKKTTQPRRPSTSVPTIRRSESDQQGRPKREIHPPASKDLPYTDIPRKPRRTKGKRDNGSQEQLRFCGKLLQSLHSKSLYNTACHFYEPVDHVKLDIPSYPKVIKKPMDMSTMRKKLDAGEYPNAQKFYDDFKLMIRNCFTFNPEGTLVNQAGVELQKVFDDKWKGLPPLREVGSDDDEEDDESDDEQSRELVAAMESQIEFLNRNLEAIKKKPKDKKKEKRKDKPLGVASNSSKSQANKAYQPTKQPKKSKKAGGDDALSFEQKKDLSDTIATLEGAKLERVIQIIHEGVPEIRDSTEEIELDIDSLPQAVLMKLYNFVLRPIRNPPKRSRGVGGGTGGLKRKSMDEDVEAERIRQLEERIALFNGEPATSTTGNTIRPGGSAQSSDNSSDESSGSDSE